MNVWWLPWGLPHVISYSRRTPTCAAFHSYQIREHVGRTLIVGPASQFSSRHPHACMHLSFSEYWPGKQELMEIMVKIHASQPARFSDISSHGGHGIFSLFVAFVTDCLPEETKPPSPSSDRILLLRWKKPNLNVQSKCLTLSRYILPTLSALD